MKMLPAENLAPLKPLLQLKAGDRSDGKESSLADQFQEILKDVLHQDEPTWREVANTVEVVSNFVQGKQIFQYNPHINEWQVQSLRRVNPNKITAINIMQFYLTDNIQRLVSVNPDLEPEDTFLQSKYRKQVKYAKAVWNYFEPKFYTPWFNQQEAVHQILTGNVIESVQYDPLARGAVAFKEIFGQKEIEISPGMGECIDCGHEGTGKDFMEGEESIPRCPACGSYGVIHEGSASELIDMPMGQQPVHIGEPRLRLIPIQTCRFSLKVRPEESPYFLERQMVPLNRIHHLFGQNIDLAESATSADRGLQVTENMQTAGNTLFGQSSAYRSYEGKRKEVLIDRLSLTPEMYAHVKCYKDEKTIDGKVLKKGTSFLEYAKNGVTLLIGNEKNFLGVYPNITHQEEITSGIHHMRLNSGLGRGAEDTVEVQKRFNRFDNQHVKIMQAAATPAHTFIEGAVDMKHVKKIGQPNAAIPIRQEIALALGGKTDLISQIKPATVAGNFFQYTYDILNQYRQLTAHSTTFSNGLPGVDNSTATGARIGDANSASIYIPMLQMKAEIRKGTAHKTIRAIHKHHGSVSRFYSFGKTASEQVVGEVIKGSDLSPDIKFTVVRDSELPKNRYNRQQDFERMMLAVGGVEGLMMLKETMPEMFSHIQATYGQEIGQRSYSTLEDICRDRLEQVLNAIPAMQMALFQATGEPISLEQVLTPDMLVSMIEPQITVAEPSHDLKATWFADYLDTPEGYNLGTQGRVAVQLMAQLHLMLHQQQSGTIGKAGVAAEVMAQEPAMEQQAAAAGAQFQGERMAAEQDHALGMEADKNQARLDIEKERAKAYAQAKAQEESALGFGDGAKGQSTTSK